MTTSDLTYTLGAYLDRHLVFPLLEFLQEKEVRGLLSRADASTAGSAERWSARVVAARAGD